MSDVSIYVVCALCGNAWRESHINPGQHELGNDIGYGLYMWSYERRDRLISYLQANGYSQYSPEGQMEYLILENNWKHVYGEYATLSDFLASDSTDIHYLTECFCRCWERPGVPALEDRFQFADDAYQYIVAHGDEDREWVVEVLYDTMISREQALNNAVMMWKYYGEGIIPDPPNPPNPKPVNLLMTIIAIIAKKRGRLWF